MSKSVYSIVLMDDVVDKIDRLAYKHGTNRSNMINRILAEYAGMVTPEKQIQDIFLSIQNMLDTQSELQSMLSDSNSMFSIRSALQYKYNPSVKYVVELYEHTDENIGELRVALRTQSMSLLLYLEQFYRLWAKCENSFLNTDSRNYTIEGGRYTRKLKTPHGDFTSGEIGNAITSYVQLFDACLKKYFEYLDDCKLGASQVVSLYKNNLDSLTAQL